MLKDDLIALIRGTSSLDFCRKHLFSPQAAWFFEHDPKKEIIGNYEEFRLTLANLIDENPNNIAIVGSAKFGWSMNPSKLWNPFTPESDIDVVIISPRLFAEAWDAYRRAYYNGYTRLKRHGRTVFRNFVVIDIEELQESQSVYLQDMLKKIDGLQRQMELKHGISYSIKFRIYNSYHDAENYHSAGLDRLKKGYNNEPQ